MKIPYGVASFHTIRSRGEVYVDRTDQISVLENTGDALLFLRPRRFGKSLWLSTLSHYYDLRTSDDHEMLFGGLAAETPTASAHQYFILPWDFSKIDPDPPRSGVNAGIDSHHERIGNELRGYLNTAIEVFQRDYEEHLPEILELEEDPFLNFERLLSVIRKTPNKLYLLIDEYDNFANEVLVNNEEHYRELVHSDGPFKYLFKWIKGLMGNGLERLFITGVSPMVMSDVTSGLNIADNVYLSSPFAALCGFRQEEVEELLKTLYAEQESEACGPSWTTEEALRMVRDWYNGYRFVPTADPSRVPAVYNPTLVFYFLKQLQREGIYPAQMLDANLAADEGKLDYLAQIAEGRDAIIELVRREEPVEVSLLRDRFTLRELLDRTAQDEDFVAAYLYYFGMLTLAGQSSRRTWLLEIPNGVVRGLYLERIKRLLLPLGADRNKVKTPSLDLMEGKDIEPFLDAIESTLFPTFSNRDSVWANELTVKTIFLTLLWNEASYVTYSEPELDHRYADLCMLRRPDARESTLRDLLFELKYLPLKDLNMTGENVKAASRDDLAQLAPVREALDRAEGQIDAYSAALRRRLGDDLRLRAYAVVALGFERLVVRVVG